jgi:hypothetical protein
MGLEGGVSRTVQDPGTETVETVRRGLEAAYIKLVVMGAKDMPAKVLFVGTVAQRMLTFVRGKPDAATYSPATRLEARTELCPYAGLVFATSCRVRA